MYVFVDMHQTHIRCFVTTSYTKNKKHKIMSVRNCQTQQINKLGHELQGVLCKVRHFTEDTL